MHSNDVIEVFILDKKLLPSIQFVLKFVIVTLYRSLFISKRSELVGIFLAIRDIPIYLIFTVLLFLIL